MMTKKILLLLSLTGSLLSHAASLEVVGYFPSWSVADPVPFEINAQTISAANLTVINYAFLDICWDGLHGNPAVTNKNDVHDCLDKQGEKITPPNGSIVLGNPLWDADVHGRGKNNLAKLLALKAVNPQLKLVASVGGWDWSNRFSLTARQAQTRDNFSASAVEFLRASGFDGIDIDWEFPTAIGVPCTPRQQCDDPDDKANYVLLLQTLRHFVDRAGREDGKHYLLTIAAGSTPKFIHKTQSEAPWLAELAHSVDWINLMNYDYHGPWESRAGLNSPLQSDALDLSETAVTTNAQAMVTLLLRYVPAQQLVLGVPFYGYSWPGCQPGAQQDGLYQSCQQKTAAEDWSFTRLTTQGYLLLDEHGEHTRAGRGFTRYWNQDGAVPYLYNSLTRQFISYEDEQSIHAKDFFILQNGLLGAMFWELNADREKILGTVVAHDLLDQVIH